MHFAQGGDGKRPKTIFIENGWPGHEYPQEVCIEAMEEFSESIQD
jgi:hypothetical protein